MKKITKADVVRNEIKNAMKEGRDLESVIAWSMNKFLWKKGFAKHNVTKFWNQINKISIPQKEPIATVTTKPDTEHTGIISFDPDYNSYDDGADLIRNFNEDYGSFSIL